MPAIINSWNRYLQIFAQIFNQVRTTYKVPTPNMFKKQVTNYIQNRMKTRPRELIELMPPQENRWTTLCYQNLLLPTLCHITHSQHLDNHENMLSKKRLCQRQHSRFVNWNLYPNRLLYRNICLYRKSYIRSKHYFSILVNRESLTFLY